MFTGIVEALGIIKSFQKSGNGAVMTVHAPGLDFSDVKIGDSIACNGVCVTVTSFTRDTFTADLSLETLSCTSFKKAAPGKVINLEKAMSLSGRMGGHIVQGHVDAIGEILSITAKGEVREVWITLDENIARYIVHKGSVTVDGISLTVNEVLPDRFRLTLIPHTGSVTTVSSAKATRTAPKTGDTNNLVLWLILLIAAAAAISGIVVYGRKRKHTR